MNKILLNVGETCKIPEIGVVQYMDDKRTLNNLDGDNVIFKLVD